jgi:hypothetical protein
MPTLLQAPAVCLYNEKLGSVVFTLHHNVRSCHTGVHASWVFLIILALYMHALLIILLMEVSMSV